MLKQIKLLTVVMLRNLFGVNEIIHTKDHKKRGRFLGLSLVYIMLIAMMVFYMVIMSKAYVMINMTEIIPIYLFLLTSLIILFFSFFKAASVIFQMNSYEMLVSLPVSKAAIVVSRFLTMYVTNLLLSLIVVIPGMIIYAMEVQPGVSFYVYFLLGTVLLPLLPITIATAVGAVITAISARMKHKSLIASLLTVLFAVLLIVGSSVISGNAPELNENIARDLAEIIKGLVSKLYLPALWFGNATVEGDFLSFVWLFASSAGIFVGMILILQKYFLSICTALNATSAKNNYKFKGLSAGSPLKALWKRELKRYFASSIYVSNTMIGYILMAVLAITLLVMGPEKVEEMLQMPNVINKALPMVLSMIAAIMPITCCSISMEGKQWWIAQTLPVSSKDVFTSKILVNLTIAAPFYLVAVVCACLAIQPSILELVWIILVPAVYILFTAVLGITINLLIPVMEWDNEVRVVKQSTSTLFTMLLGMISCLPALACLFLLDNNYKNVIYLATILVILLITTTLYRKNNKAKLIKIGEK